MKLPTHSIKRTCCGLEALAREGAVPAGMAAASILRGLLYLLSGLGVCKGSLRWIASS